MGHHVYIFDLIKTFSTVCVSQFFLHRHKVKFDRFTTCHDVSLFTFKRVVCVVQLLSRFLTASETGSSAQLCLLF
jgi:hypothetical protein